MVDDGRWKLYSSLLNVLIRFFKLLLSSVIVSIISKMSQLHRTVIKRKCKWTVHEKKIIFRILRQHGDHNISEFVQKLPTKTEHQIRRLLDSFKKSASKKLKLRQDFEVQEILKKTVHPWIPFIKAHNNVSARVHEHIPAFILPLIESIIKLEKKSNIDFGSAYNALFRSMTEQEFPEELNQETFSMIFASMNQLLADLRSSNIPDLRTLSNCVERHFTGNSAMISRQNDDCLFQLPEVNVLNLTMEEMNLICKNVS